MPLGRRVTDLLEALSDRRRRRPRGTLAATADPAGTTPAPPHGTGPRDRTETTLEAMFAYQDELVGSIPPQRRRGRVRGGAAR